MTEQKETTKRTIVAEETDPVRDAVQAVRAKRAKLRNAHGISGRDVLAYPSRDGFKRRVVNDRPGRVSMFESKGWEIVRGDLTGGQVTAKDPKKPGTAVTKIVGDGERGPITGVLMEIPEEIYNEDQRKKQDEIKQTEDIMEHKLKKDSVRWKGHSVKSDFG